MIDYVANFNRMPLRHMKTVVKWAGVPLKSLHYGSHSVTLFDVGGEFVEVFYSTSGEIMCINSIYPFSPSLDEYLADIELPI